METDSGVESAETLPSGAEIITTKTEMETESWKRLLRPDIFTVSLDFPVQNTTQEKRSIAKIKSWKVYSA